MKTSSLRLFLIGSLILSIILVSSCKKEEKEETPQAETGTFTDSRDGKVYKWVKIGDQTWMAENLAYQPGNTNDYIAYDNDINNVTTYGYLYPKNVAETIAPDGWRLPTENDFRTLVNKLGGRAEAYNKLLESGTTHWQSPNDGTNESGFTALPGGKYIHSNNDFWGMGQLAVFVSSDLYTNSTTAVMVLNLNRNFKEASVEGNEITSYYSVRCIKE